MQHTGTSRAAKVGLPDADVHATHPGADPGALAAPMVKPRSRLRENEPLGPSSPADGAPAAPLP
eukprot:3241361-Alexandrium_andersonii.AAC.1